MSTQYDAVIIGAGMSGLATAIRLGMFNKKVLVLEKHSISGGLNSYYSRRIKETKEIINFDVGLHALTNFATKGERRKPLTKLLKQLRLSYDDLALEEQSFSQIKFKSASLDFSNDFELLKSEIAAKFPGEIDQFSKFVTDLLEFNEVDLNATYTPAREVLSRYFKEELLIEMLLAPLLIYGSAWENDMDYSQFVIMFKSIYMEGFSRPKGGVRTIIDLLLNKLDELGVEVRFNCGVKSIIKENDLITGVITKKDETIKAKKVFSSAGLPETYGLISEEDNSSLVGKLSFMETIIVTRDKSFLESTKPTIIFYNDSDKYNYKKSAGLYDPSSAVFCLPDNYSPEIKDGYGTIRATYIANFDKWAALERAEYKAQKENVFNSVVGLTKTLMPQYDLDYVYQDVFSPTTIKRYTNHFDGTVYGSTTKVRDGKSKYKNLIIIGTDQGFLGIVGSILSGISMANFHGLMEES